MTPNVDHDAARQDLNESSLAKSIDGQHSHNHRLNNKR